MKKGNSTTQFVKRYCTAKRIASQGRLTPEIIAIERLVEKLEIRDRNRAEARLSRPFETLKECNKCGVDCDPHAVSGMCERCETASEKFCQDLQEFNRS